MQKLVELAKKRFEERKSQQINYTGIRESDAFVNDIEKHPHAYVLACLMNRQVQYERAEKIPYDVCQEIGSQKISDLANLSEKEYIDIFEKKRLHRFNETMAKIFHKAVLRIRDEYENDASKIWSGNPSSSSVVYRFLQFNGSGIKISTMAANILARDLKVPLSDYYSIDISPDVHVRRVMGRLYQIDKNATDLIIYKARELNPDYPGIIDLSCWEIGRDFCKPTNPNCKDCIVRDECKSKDETNSK